MKHQATVQSGPKKQPCFLNENNAVNDKTIKCITEALSINKIGCTAGLSLRFQVAG